MLTFKDKMLEDGTSPANANVKLQRLRTLLQYAVANDVIEKNPGTGISVRDIGAAKRKRIEYDPASLEKLFGGPVHANGERPAAGAGEAAYWLPLIGLYTGARLKEMGQLSPTDVYQQSYLDADEVERMAWVISVTDEGEGQRLKNESSIRIVPVHPELERLGFIAFAEAAKRKGQTMLFPDLNPDKYGDVTGNWSKWFGRYKRERGITDKRLTFHSLRHSFKHYARHVGMVEGVQRQIMGHSPEDVADDYGNGYSLHPVLEGMKLYRVPGFRFSGDKPLTARAAGAPEPA